MPVETPPMGGSVKQESPHFSEVRFKGIRTIIFRGKCKYNGKWIEGYLVELGKESFSDPERYGICNKAIPLGGSGVCYNLKIDEVIPETVGQYTGLTDKNGKKIFEGDIVQYYDAYPHEVYIEKGHTKTRWYDTVSARKYDGIFFSIDREGYDECEVIGNIHDNTELLKVCEK